MVQISVTSTRAESQLLNKLDVLVKITCRFTQISLALDNLSPETHNAKQKSSW